MRASLFFAHVFLFCLLNFSSSIHHGKVAIHGGTTPKQHRLEFGCLIICISSCAIRPAHLLMNAAASFYYAAGLFSRFGPGARELGFALCRISKSDTDGCVFYQP